MSQRSGLVYEMLRHLRPLVLNSSRVVDDRVRAEGWTVGTRAVAEVLAAEGASTVPQIARAMDLPRQAVQRHVDELVRRGDVASRANPAHLRSVLIDLTASGASRFDRVRAAEIGELTGLAADCSAAELRTAAKVLASLDRDIRAKAAVARGTVSR